MKLLDPPAIIAPADLPSDRVTDGPEVHGVETILIVEDQAAIRDIARRLLRRQGYVVLVASSGAEALAISAELATPIHLVISDAVMPGMGGAEVVRRLKLQRPEIKVLFMSGYADDEVVRRGIASAAVPFVQKPFDLAVLERAVRDALDAA